MNNPKLLSESKFIYLLSIDIFLGLVVNLKNTNNTKHLDAKAIASTHILNLGCPSHWRKKPQVLGEDSLISNQLIRFCLWRDAFITVHQCFWVDYRIFMPPMTTGMAGVQMVLILFLFQTRREAAKVTGITDTVPYLWVNKAPGKWPSKRIEEWVSEGDFIYIYLYIIYIFHL